MFGIMLPITAICATSGKRRNTVTATYSANSTRPTNAACSTYSPGAANSPDTTDPSRPAYATSAADTTRSANVAAIAAARDWIRRARATDVATVPAIDIAVPAEIVVVIDVDVVATPTASPSPSTTPERSHHHANTEGDRHPRRVIAPGRVIDGRIWINRRTINDNRIIRRHVQDFRAGRLNDDDVLLLDDLRFDFLLFRGFQMPFVLRLLAHALYSIHKVRLLSQECISQIGRPLNVVGKPFHYFGNSGQSLHAWIPRLLRRCIGECLVLEVRIFLQPLLELDDLERIG